jgi:hypothetical protein
VKRVKKTAWIHIWYRIQVEGATPKPEIKILIDSPLHCSYNQPTKVSIALFND